MILCQSARQIRETYSLPEIIYALRTHERRTRIQNCQTAMLQLQATNSGFVGTTASFSHFRHQLNDYATAPLLLEDTTPEVTIEELIDER